MARIITLRDKRKNVVHKVRFIVSKENGICSLWVWETGHFPRAHWSTVGSCSLRMVFHPSRGQIVIGIKIRNAPSLLHRDIDEVYKVSYLVCRALSRDADAWMISRETVALMEHYTTACKWLIKHMDPVIPESALQELKRHRNAGF